MVNLIVNGVLCTTVALPSRSIFLALAGVVGINGFSVLLSTYTFNV